MGFYAPGTLVEDARRHGVEVRPVDVTRSGWEATLEPREAPTPSVTSATTNGVRVRGASTRTSLPLPPAPAVRLGLRSVRGLGATARDRLERALAEGPFTSIDDVVRRSGLDQRGCGISPKRERSTRCCRRSPTCGSGVPRCGRCSTRRAAMPARSPREPERRAPQVRRRSHR
jgi:hypothetical protein